MDTGRCPGGSECDQCTRAFRVRAAAKEPAFRDEAALQRAEELCVQHADACAVLYEQQQQAEEPCVSEPPLEPERPQSIATPVIVANGSTIGAVCHVFGIVDERLRSGQAQYRVNWAGADGGKSEVESWEAAKGFEKQCPTAVHQWNDYQPTDEASSRVPVSYAAAVASKGYCCCMGPGCSAVHEPGSGAGIAAGSGAVLEPFIWFCSRSCQRLQKTLNNKDRHTIVCLAKAACARRQEATLAESTPPILPIGCVSSNMLLTFECQRFWGEIVDPSGVIELILDDRGNVWTPLFRAPRTTHTEDLASATIKARIRSAKRGSSIRLFSHHNICKWCAAIVAEWVQLAQECGISLIVIQNESWLGYGMDQENLRSALTQGGARTDSPDNLSVIRVGRDGNHVQCRGG